MSTRNLALATHVSLHLYLFNEFYKGKLYNEVVALKYAMHVSQNHRVKHVVFIFETWECKFKTFCRRPFLRTCPYNNMFHSCLHVCVLCNKIASVQQRYMSHSCIYVVVLCVWPAPAYASRSILLIRNDTTY